MGGRRSNPGRQFDAGRAGLRSEDLLIRNHDFQWGYDLEVAIRDGEGTAFEERYYLQPGATRSELDVVAPGEYTVHVVLDNRREVTAECAVGDEPAGGVLVELGYGAVSVRDRLNA